MGVPVPRIVLLPNEMITAPPDWARAAGLPVSVDPVRTNVLGPAVCMAKVVFLSITVFSTMAEVFAAMLKPPLLFVMRESSMRVRDVPVELMPFWVKPWIVHLTIEAFPDET